MTYSIINSWHMKKSAGFTLIELSVVLVIIGLLVGGILVGRDLIRSSEIRGQISQIEEMVTAINTFKIKYGYMPGDMPPNQSVQLGLFTFTGAQAGKTCSFFEFGNNDGGVNIVNEAYAFWSHLADANLVKGSYGGKAGNLLRAAAANCLAMTAGQPTSVPTTEAGYDLYLPRPKMPVKGHILASENHNNGNLLFNNTTKANALFIIPMVGTSDIYSANQAYQIDSNMDDGMPATGNVREKGTFPASTGVPADNAPCTSSGVSPIKYDLSSATADVANCTGLGFLF
ncbi:MAG: prepilin-type N-terminal cleavage/methylation domain-containing protein [Pseudomonadota bacterium]